MADKQKTDHLPTTKLPDPAASLADTEPGQSDPQFQELLSKLPEPAKLVGPYELIRKLGKGGMGNVWLARHTTNRKLVALKLLHKSKFDNIQRYLLVRREIEAQANLSHPHIVKILDVGLPELHQGMLQKEIRQRLTAEPMYVAFEYIEDAKMLSNLIKGDQLSHQRIAELVTGLAKALAYAHEQGVYHLDVKPDNVLIDRDGKLLLADFGLGSFAGCDPGEASGGTPLYMSPERLLQREHDLAARDIWAVGVVFYELLTGQRPFRKTADITDKQFDYRAIPEVDAETPELFVDLCNSCLERDHEIRCPSARHVATELQQWLDNQRARPRRRALTVGIVVLLLLVIVGIGSGVAWLNGLFGRVTDQVADVKKDAEQESQKTAAEIAKLYEDPDVLSGKLKSHIRKVADKQIDELRIDSANWRKIDEVEKQRDKQLDRVEQLVTTIRDGLVGDPDPIFADSARILADQGVDEALAFLKEKQPVIETRVRETKARRDRAQQDFHASLEPWLMEAELHEKNLAWNKSLERYEQVASEAPEWSRAQRKLGDLLVQLAEFEQAEPHLKAALKLADGDQQRALAAGSLGLLYLHQARWNDVELHLVQYLELAEQVYGPNHLEVAMPLNNLARLLTDTSRLTQAEPLYRRALAIVEQSYGDEHAYVAAPLNNLAVLLKATSRLAEAEPLMRRALAIDEQSHGAEHSNVARDLSNLAMLLLATNRLAEAEPLMRRALAIDERSRGPEHPTVAGLLSNLARSLQVSSRLGEAEPLMRRALAITERSHGPDHPHVAIQLSNLATLLQGTDRPRDAEPLFRRALAIDRQSYGDEDPHVARDLNNLASLLQVTNRLPEAEPLFRRALAIWEQSYGAQHTDVAACLNNLAQLLQVTNRLPEAEPLSRRMLEIFVLFGKATGHDHPHLIRAKRNHVRILLALELGRDEIEHRLAVIGRVEEPLKPIYEEVERLLDPTKSVQDVLAVLDEQYRKENKPAIYFLPIDEPICPHVDDLLGPSKLAAQPDKTITDQIDDLLGPVKLPIDPDKTVAEQLDTILGPERPVEEVLKALDEQYRAEGRPEVWFLPLDEPISPHLDELLGAKPATES